MVQSDSAFYNFHNFRIISSFVFVLKTEHNIETIIKTFFSSLLPIRSTLGWLNMSILKHLKCDACDVRSKNCYQRSGPSCSKHRYINELVKRSTH